MIKSLAHVAINTTDFERSFRFYHESLGFPVAEELELDRGVRLVHFQVESVAEFGIWGHDGHFGGHFQRSYLSARPSTNLAALSLGILVSLSGILPLKDVGSASRWRLPAKR